MFNFKFYKYLYARYLTLRFLIFSVAFLLLGAVALAAGLELRLLPTIFFGALALSAAERLVRELKWQINLTKYAVENIHGSPVSDLYEALVRDFEYVIPRDENGDWIQHSAGETFETKSGVCWDLCNLLHELYREVGVSSKFVWVFVDQDGDEVAHICLEVQGQLVDPVYKTLNAKHKSYDSCMSLNLAIP